MLSDSARSRYFWVLSDGLIFVWIWVCFRFSVWFESQTFIHLFSNRSEYRERRLFVFRSQLVFYSLSLSFGWCFQFSDWFRTGRFLPVTSGPIWGCGTAVLDVFHLPFIDFFFLSERFDSLEFISSRRYQDNLNLHSVIWRACMHPI